MKFDSKTLVFIAIFSVLAIIAGQINFSPLLGAPNQFFTLFQFFGPIAGMFLGSLFGGISVVLAETANFFILGKELNIVNVFRLFPMAFAAYYFGTQKKKDWSLIVPLVAIGAFLLHPVGREVWYFALFWTIPLIARLVAPTNLLAKSIGATFTAHSVGGAIWIYVFPTTAVYWNTLIPIVAFERTLFAIGIAASFVIMTTVLSRIEQLIPQGTISIDKKYDIVRLFASKN